MDGKEWFAKNARRLTNGSGNYEQNIALAFDAGLKLGQQDATSQPASEKELDKALDHLRDNHGWAVLSHPVEREEIKSAFRRLTVARSDQRTETVRIPHISEWPSWAIGIRLVYEEVGKWSADQPYGRIWPHGESFTPRPVAKMRQINREEMISAVISCAEYRGFSRALCEKFSDGTLLDLCKNAAGIALEVPV
jgi:hypothetical protein